jgi:hypothetical protein
MKKSIRKFLQFHGRTISFLHKDGQYWIAIRPICEALNLKYAWHLEQLKKHPIWGVAYQKQGIPDARNHVQEMVALPEKYVYMWIAQLPLKSKEHIEYVRECVDVLFDYFHGTITGRQELLLMRAEVQMEKSEVESILRENKQYQRLLELERQESAASKGLRALDQTLVNKQLTLGLD